jgi:hypothetical protein
VLVMQDNAFRWMRNLHAIGSTQVIVHLKP